MQAKWSVAAAAAALLLSASAGANAQQYQQWQQRQGQQSSSQQGSGQQGIEQEVRSFVQQSEQTINRAVQQGDENAIRQWTQMHIDDSASLSMLMQTSGSGRTPKGLQATVLDKQEMMKRQSAMFSLMPDLLKLVNNYDLSIRLLNVEPISDNAAIVKTRITESGTIGGRQATASSSSYGRQTSTGQQSSSTYQQDQSQSGQTAATGAGSGQQSSSGQQRFGQSWGQSVSFNGVAECTQLIHREQTGNRMTIGLSNCTAEMSF